MMTKKIIAVLSSVLLLAGSALPVFAETLTITGNGSDSVNSINTTVTNTTQVSQTNTANINNNVTTTSNTGDNTASHNTGGAVTVDTGSAKSQVSVTNTANTNVAAVDNCNCGTGNLDVKLSGNGDGSKNTADTKLTNQVQLNQTNVGFVSNDVNAKSNSGDNKASYNTGGDVSISTGNALTSVSLKTNANQNLATVGGGHGGAGTTDIMITGNGSDTKNTVNLGLTDWVVLGQTNVADVNNDVYAKSNTGKNTADHNTGGSLFGNVTIDTGNAVTGVSADTAVNFNEAAIGCDCVMGVNAKISGNGASDGWWWPTTSKINADITNGQLVGQTNGGEGINNDLDGKSKTGDNRTSLNTGESVDPSVMTGDSWSVTDVKNSGNANVFGSVSTPFPWTWNNSNVTFSFSLQDLLLTLGIH